MNLGINLINFLFALFLFVILMPAFQSTIVRPLRKDAKGNTEYSRFKSKNPKDNWINFLWRKKYRGFLWLVGVLGTGMILFLDNLIQGTNIWAKDELSAAVLFITAVIVFWYTREAFDSKVIAQKGVEQNRITQKNEFLPILVPSGDNVMQGGDIRMDFSNVGKGIAKNINIWVGGFTVLENFTLRVNQTHTLHVYDNDNIRALTNDTNTRRVSVEMRYKDVYERTIRTFNLNFYRDDDPGNRFVLDKHQWEFKTS